MINSLKSTTTDALMQELASIQSGQAEGILRASAILCELRDRKTFHPAMKTAILRWFAEIHAEKLHPQFVIMFAGVQTLIKAAVGTPLDKQEAWAAGGDVDIAEVNTAYQVVEAKKPLIRFTPTDIKTAFCERGLRPMPEQKLIVEQRIHAAQAVIGAPESRVKADVKAGVLLIAGLRLRPGELIEAMQALGYMVRQMQDA